VNLLGFDTSTAATSVCLVRADGAAFESNPEVADLFAPPAHARELMPAIARVMEEAGVDWPELDAIAVGEGPGRFTGLRIGIATARGLAQAGGIELRPVSSLAALAAGIEAPFALPLIDARRGEVFGALYEHGNEVWEPFVARPEELVERLERTGAGALCAGDGSLRFSEELRAAGVEVASDDSRLHVVRALNLCLLASSTEARPPEAVLPRYLRSPDAKPAT
jgi:tRNA threonylcarbamoyladenosine biosynthesis protein TsaB